ncbi:MAG: choline monooxygenase [Actinomycetota bacterium]|nr:choline monooxygenase [Actinomycetota bacterium]
MDTRFLLSPEAYFDDGWYGREQQLLFARSWHLAASADELTEPGDFVTIDAGFDPLVVVRGLDGVLRAFHDFCPHRGIKLLEESGNTRTGIVCPYHSWNFALDGTLRNVPQEDEFDPAALEGCGLLAASVGEWGGMVFVNAQPAADFTTWLDAFPDHIGSYRPERLSEVTRVQFDARCNWKLFVENHVDVYHLWYLHARSLSAYDHQQFEWSAVGPHWVSYEPAKDGVERKRPHVGSTPIKDLDARDQIGIGAHMLFPNTLFATESEFFMSYVAKPLAADRSVIDVRIRAEPSADVEMLVAAAKEFMLEDVRACEGIQATVRSSRFRVGPLAQNHERPITLFHRHLQAALDP